MMDHQSTHQVKTIFGTVAQTEACHRWLEPFQSCGRFEAMKRSVIHDDLLEGGAGMPKIRGASLETGETQKHWRMFLELGVKWMLA